MSAKEIKFDQQAGDAILRGVNTMVDAVKVTLGPRGRNVIMVTMGTKTQPKLAMPARAESGRPLFRDEIDARQKDKATNALTTLRLRANPPMLSSRASAPLDHVSTPNGIETRLITRSARAAKPAIHASGGTAAK